MPLIHVPRDRWKMVTDGRILRALERAGHIREPGVTMRPSKNGKPRPWSFYCYVRPVDSHSFEHAGRKYRLFHRDGCFFPFVWVWTPVEHKGRPQTLFPLFGSDPKDSVRLEWMISRGAFISWSRDYEVCNVWFSHDPASDGGGAPVEGYPQKCYHDPREAIDKAMLFSR